MKYVWRTISGDKENGFVPAAMAVLKRRLFPVVAFTSFPFLAYAQGGGIADFVVQIESILDSIIPFLVGLAVFLIIWGIFTYISHAADEEKRKEARDFIMWGVFGVFLMLSVWGLVSILVNTFNLDNSNAIVDATYPTKDATLPTASPQTLLDLIHPVTGRMAIVGNYIIGFLIGIAVFIVIWGILNYIRQGANEEKRAEGRMFVIWGVISIFLMLSIWGLVNILVNTFDLSNKAPSIPDLPQVPDSSSKSKSPANLQPFFKE